MSTIASGNKGKGKATEPAEENESRSQLLDSDSGSNSSGSSDSSASEIEVETSEKLPEDRKAKSKTSNNGDNDDEEDLIILQNDTLPPLPSLNPGPLPKPYFLRGSADSKSKLLLGPSSIRDPEIERLEKSPTFLSGPAPPVPPPELTNSGKPLTKKERKELRHKTAGPGWFEMPAPAEADLPRMYREVEALRLRNQLDPKRFYRKDEGEGKGIKGLPKYFAIGTILPTDTPFGASTSDNLTRANRKRTLVDELVDDAEAKRYAKKKFNELQTVRGARGKNTLKAKLALRKPKW